MRVTEQTIVPGHCPSCERFVGAAYSCPYCDADMPGGLSLRTLRYAAIGLAVLGLAFLLIAARGKGVPRVKVSSIRPRMNYGYVEVLGTVPREPYVSKNRYGVSHISFDIDDGTGVLRVVAYGKQAARIVEDARLPKRGDTVAVAGSLRVSAGGGARLQVQIPEHVKRHQGPAGAVAPPTGYEE